MGCGCRGGGASSPVQTFGRAAQAVPGVGEVWTVRYPNGTSEDFTFYDDAVRAVRRRGGGMQRKTTP